MLINLLLTKLIVNNNFNIIGIFYLKKRKELIITNFS